MIFVTHDIDEAITMGDRIAILREGGVLAQYDTPDAILAHPADDFVAQFIGEDRALRRSRCGRLADVTLEPLDGDERRPTAPTRRRSAMRSACCSAGADRSSSRTTTGRRSASCCAATRSRSLVTSPPAR